MEPNLNEGEPGHQMWRAGCCGTIELVPQARAGMPLRSKTDPAPWVEVGNLAPDLSSRDKVSMLRARAAESPGKGLEKLLYQGGVPGGESKPRRQLHWKSVVVRRGSAA